MPCSYPECGRHVFSAGLCYGHYRMQCAGAPLRPLRRIRKPKDSSAHKIAVLETQLEARCREAHRVQECYASVLGIENRLHWRKNLQAIQDEIQQLEERLEKLRKHAHTRS